MPNKVKMQLVGLNGNAYSLMGAFSYEARKQGWSKDEIEVVMDECMSDDYNHLLCTLMDNIDDSNIDEYEDDDEDEYEVECEDE